METVKTERLAGWGSETAGSIHITGTISGKRTARRLSAAMARIAALARLETSPAWYTDNEYLVRREGAVAKEAFRSGGRLRRCPEGAVLVTLCRRLAEVGPISEERVEEFFIGVRRSDQMPESEAALLGAALRMAVIEELADGADAAAAGELFTSLRAIAESDLTDALERSDPVDELLRHDAVYPLMDEITRALYRRKCQKLARLHGSTPLKEAETALESGLHAYLFPTVRRTGAGYIAARAAITAALTLWIGVLTRSPWVALLTVLPLSELAGSMMDTVLLRLVNPRRLPRLELRDGVGADGRTICVISALLTDESIGPALSRRLEEYRLANRDCGGELLFVLLADLPDAKVYPIPGGEVRLERAKAAVEELNLRWGGGFFLLTRDPVRNAVDGRYAPWERKRGAILELCRLAQGKQNSLRCLAGDRKELHARYILCLDGDTRLVPGSARALIGAAMHPCSRPVVENGRVVRGHGVIHPRMSVELESALATDFSRLYAGQGGIDPYGAPTGELFSDLYERGGFSGKGIVDAASYLECLEARFPENTVLSHDALEGAYLRGAYMGDVELTDAAPVSAFSWFRRMSRWTRGDWQNLPWLFRAGRDLSALDRWRLYDSLRRSMAAPASFLSLSLALFFPALLPAGLVTLLCLGADALRAAMTGLFLPARDARLRCRSGVLRGVSGAFTRLLCRLILLPWEAFTCLGAAFLALWRMGVSHKNMLQWTTAAQAESGARPPAALWLTLFTGAALVFLAPGPAGKAVGFVWLFTPYFAVLSARKTRPKNDLSDSDRRFLLDCARSIWNYFDQNCSRQDHWLPPDNIQIQPPKGTARRTSPTNIGMAVSSALAALELGLCTPERAAELIERIMSTIETLPRWKGHLYNWYDTGTCAPLQPAYVSTVDSGNLCACLIAASHGLAAHGYARLAKRVKDFADGIDLGALYDRKRRLFRIGMDPATGAPSPGHYDLMASEARLTSFIACARGEVPQRHWQALSRAQLSLDGWRGLASWSGSMFEYLMPELFLPLVRGSMLWETGRFCLYAQRRRPGAGKHPWGSSESGFFSLDASLDYRYKAHGAGALALRRDMDGEYVVAPYASFLALCVHPKAAVNNLRRLKRAGLWGTYGHYEALDLTPGRTGTDGEPVMSFMSHHLGMSLCAAANCLRGGIMRRYFMEAAEFAAFRPLLSERVPLGGPLLRRSRSPLTRPPEARPDCPVFSLEGTGWQPDAPAFFPMSNGVYSILAGADGSCAAQSGGILMYRPDGGFEIAAAERMLTPSRRLGVFRHWNYAGGVLTWTTPCNTSVLSTSFAAASGECGELRRIIGPSRGELSIRFQPVLAKAEDYRAHPAFWRLGLHAAVRDGAVFVRRLARGALPETWLCLAATVPLRIRIGAGWQMNDPVWITASLPEGGCAALAVCFARNREDAHAGARRILTGGAADMAGSMASLLGMGARGIAAAFALCGAVGAGRVHSGPDASRKNLWAQGISGDLPILYVREPDDPEEAKRMIKRHALLTACGVKTDLVLDTGESGDYLKPRQEELRRYLDRYGLAAFEGERGGVHFGGGDAVRTAALRQLSPIADTAVRLPGIHPAADRPETPPDLCWLSGGVSFQTPPLPPRAWCNVISNSAFGYLAADCGTGFLWYRNARECPISPWLNDPSATAGGESLELITGGGRISLFADGKDPCRVIHGFGWTRWEHGRTSVTVFITLNHSARVFIIEGCGGADIGWHLPLVMAADPADAAFTITNCENGCFRAMNPRSPWPGTVFRAASNKSPKAYTCDTASWLAGRFDGRTGAGLDPCFGALFDGAGVTVLVCGCEDEVFLRKLSDPECAARELTRVRDHWRSTLGRIRIRTPEPELDRLMNGFAAYQALNCRILGRASMYQNGGAYGFRDQLQDVVNLLLIDPALARRHILKCCACQFREGDVLHWWHESHDGPRGVRTRCSDDLLWLAWAVCEYAEKTGDVSICSQTAPWLEAAELAPQEKDRYFSPAVSEESGTVLEHARRSLERVLSRGTGPHGLLLTGSGDWNDGMDRVGGESVWLTWFFAHTARRFAALTERMGQDGKIFLAAAETALRAAERAWDGSWYLRGWWQDGAPLGGAGAPACAIDSVAQSWAAFAGADDARVRTALRSCVEKLYDEAHGLTKLFWPPFGDTERDPGYIRACGPGFRENGGQYTHGALWLASALLKNGFTEEGSKILLDTIPERHSTAQWGAEPYVLAADVSANPDHYGEALWSWYTGSAGWFFRVVLEDLLGIRLADGHLEVRPCLPAGWEGYDADICGKHIHVRHGKTTIS